jgi:putative hydrolase of the HAD superfamily
MPDQHRRDVRFQMIELYIFDMGGVVSRNTDVTGCIARRLGVDRDHLRNTFQREWVELTAGLITPQQFWQRFGAATGRKVDRELWGLYFHPRPDPEVIETIAELKNRARVVVGTNTIEPHYRKHAANGDYDIFDAVYASQQMGLVKPDPAFYTHILYAENCRPEQAVFVDDVETNVEAARKLGLHGILFGGAAKLRRDLAVLKDKKNSGNEMEEIRF